MGAQEEREEAVVRELIAEAGNVPVDPAAFLVGAHDGWRSRRAVRRRARILRPLAPLLRQLLEPGEAVRTAALARGYELGWSAQEAGRVALVLTGRRLLLLELDRGGRPRDVKNQLWVAGVRRQWLRLGRLRLELAGGRRLRLGWVRRADRARLMALLAPAPHGWPPERAVLEHLCPACLRPVAGAPGAVPECPEPTCRARFRDPRRAVRLSALAPGLGLLYLRKRGEPLFLGGMGMLGAAAALARQAHRTPALLVGAAGFVLVPRLLDAWITRLVGARGLVPLADPATPGGLRNARAFPTWTPLLVAAGVALTLAFAALPFPP